MPHLELKLHKVQSLYRFLKRNRTVPIRRTTYARVRTNKAEVGTIPINIDPQTKNQSLELPDNLFLQSEQFSRPSFQLQVFFHGLDIGFENVIPIFWGEENYLFDFETEQLLWQEQVLPADPVPIEGIEIFVIEDLLGALSQLHRDLERDPSFAPDLLELMNGDLKGAIFDQDAWERVFEPLKENLSRIDDFGWADLEDGDERPADITGKIEDATLSLSLHNDRARVVSTLLKENGNKYATAEHEFALAVSLESYFALGEHFAGAPRQLPSPFAVANTIRQKVKRPFPNVMAGSLRDEIKRQLEITMNRSFADLQTRSRAILDSVWDLYQAEFFAARQMPQASDMRYYTTDIASDALVKTEPGSIIGMQIPSSWQMRKVMRPVNTVSWVKHNTGPLPVSLGGIRRLRTRT